MLNQTNDTARSALPGRAMGAIFATTGVFGIAVGGTRWVRSRRAARPFEDARPTPPPRAAVFPDPPGLR